MIEMKRCTKCGECKAEDQFFKRSDHRGKFSHCKDCIRAMRRTQHDAAKNRIRCKKYYADNREKECARKLHSTPPAKHREWELRRKYGLSVAEVDALMASQGDACAICAQPFGSRRPAVDHDHATGLVRGILCHPCNVALGSYERPGFVAAAQAYLDAHARPLKQAGGGG